jgi:signal transduction histidine kinase
MVSIGFCIDVSFTGAWFDGGDILRTKLRNGKQEKEYLDVIIRNAKRLQRLAEDILDITRIESKSLGLKKELFNLCHCRLQKPDC